MRHFTNIRFEGDCSVTYLHEVGGGNKWRMNDPLVVTWQGRSYQGIVERRIIVPAGFVHDFSSVPRLFRSLIPQMGRQNRPSIVHDYLYQNRIGDRADADLLFFDCMRAEGVGLIRAPLMYLAVRVGGRKAWET